MSEAVTVPSLMMGMTSTVSEESFAMDIRTGRHTHTHRHVHVYANFFKVLIMKTKMTRKYKTSLTVLDTN